jgi:hypothetical protein
MKGIKFILSLLIFIVLIISCGKGSDINKGNNYTVNVDCSGLFDGNVLVIDKDYKSVSKSVNGNQHQSYSYTGKSISLTFQKKEEYGNLVVELKKNGKVIKTENTTAPYGIVSITD